jgi:hypothetical protein
MSFATNMPWLIEVSMLFYLIFEVGSNGMVLVVPPILRRKLFCFTVYCAYLDRVPRFVRTEFLVFPPNSYLRKCTYGTLRTVRDYLCETIFMWDGKSSQHRFSSNTQKTKQHTKYAITNSFINLMSSTPQKRLYGTSNIINYASLQ